LELTKEVLQRRYSKFSDEALLTARSAGPGPYSPLAWEVIQELVLARGINGQKPPPAPAPAKSGSEPPKPIPAQPTQSPPAEATPATVSPYFFVSRLRGDRWQYEEDLPLTARYIVSLAALIFGAAAVGVVIAAFVFRGQAAARAPGVLELALAAGLSLGFVYSTRRQQSPATWWYATLYCSVSAVLAVGQIGSVYATRWPQLAIGGFVGALWLLYFGRRREAYGMPPWTWLD
jgi:hypothetical protein